MSVQQIDITIAPESRAFIERFSAFPGRILPAIVRGMDKAGQIALGAITRERFTGQGPFPVIEGRLGVGKTTRKHRGGQLRASLRVTKAVIDGDSVVSAMGSPLVYFGVHEYGFNGQVAVGSFTRAQKSRDTFAVKLTKTGKVSKARGKKTGTGVAFVGAHTRWLGMPARAPLGHGIADHAGEFTRQIGAALKAEFEGGRP